MNKDNYLSLRLTSADYETIREKADALNISMSELVRKACLSYQDKACEVDIATFDQEEASDYERNAYYYHRITDDASPFDGALITALETLGYDSEDIKHIVEKFGLAIDVCSPEQSAKRFLDFLEEIRDD